MRVSRRVLIVRPSSAAVATMTRGILFFALTTFSLPGSAITLKEVVQRSLENGPEVLAETNERRAREQEVEQARSGYYPRLDLTLGYGRENSDNPATRRANGKDVWLWRKEASLEARQMLFDGFHTRSEVERQTARVNSAVFRTQSVAELTALRSIQSFIDVLREERLVELAEDNLSTHERIRELISKRTAGGKSRGADLYLVDGRVALAKANVEAGKGNLENARARYTEVVGDPAPDTGTLVEPAAPGDTPPSAEAAVEAAVDSHPLLKSATADVDATRAQHEAARSPFFPRLDLELRRALNDDLDGVRGADREIQAMVRLRYNLFRGGGDLARRGKTAHLINEAKDVRESARRQIIESAQLSWWAHESTAARMEHLIQHRDSSEQTRDAYAEQFRLGVRSLLDQLDAENELFEARRSVANAQYDQLFSKYRIIGSMGKLRQELGIDVVDEGEPVPLPDYITGVGSDQ